MGLEIDVMFAGGGDFRDRFPVETVVVGEEDFDGAIVRNGGQCHVSAEVDVRAGEAEDEGGGLGGIGCVERWRLAGPFAGVREILGEERSFAEAATGERHVVFDRPIPEPPGGEVAEAGGVAQAALADFGLHGVGASAFVVHVHVQALVGPVAGEALAFAELDVYLVALRVALLEGEERFAAVFIHGGIPAVRRGGEPAVVVVERAAGEHVGAFFPAALAHEAEELFGVGGDVGVLGAPRFHAGHDFLHARGLAIGFGEIGDEGGVEQVPRVAKLNLGDGVLLDGPPARGQPGKAREALHVCRGHAAKRVAVDVHHLDGVGHEVAHVQVFGRRGVLILEGGDGFPDGHGLLLIGHAGLDERGPPGLEAGHVGDFVREDFDVRDDGGRGVWVWGRWGGRGRRGGDRGGKLEGEERAGGGKGEACG